MIARLRSITSRLTRGAVLLGVCIAASMPLAAAEKVYAQADAGALLLRGGELSALGYVSEQVDVIAPTAGLTFGWNLSSQWALEASGTTAGVVTQRLTRSTSLSQPLIAADGTFGFRHRSGALALRFTHALSPRWRLSTAAGLVRHAVRVHNGDFRYGGPIAPSPTPTTSPLQSPHVTTLSTSYTIDAGVAATLNPSWLASLTYAFSGAAKFTTPYTAVPQRARVHALRLGVGKIW